ncbi:MAG: hypothetical protein SNJ71_01830 [Bacteroidales bacterium]
MKTSSLIVAVLLLAVESFSQTKFEKRMLANIDSMYKWFGTPRIQESINAFERYADADTTRWEALYYAAYGYCMMSLMEQDINRKDAYCDRADFLINKALVKYPQESELYVLQGFMYNMKLLVNPTMRANDYMGLIYKSYATAEALNPNNPRVYFMKGNLIMNLPPFMGGGKDKALPIFQTAKQKYEAFTSDNILSPRWGKEDCDKKIVECSR